MINYLLFAVIGLSFLPQLIMLITQKRVFKKVILIENELPFVSILISIRNEEKNLKELCHSLSQLTYPKDKFEILIADDASDDFSLELLKEIKPTNALLFSMPEKETGQFGKLKVLKMLTKKAKGEFFLFTDGDMTFRKNWIQRMLPSKSQNIQLMLGVTLVSGNKWFQKLQNIDWLFNQTAIAWLTHNITPITAWGNNMMIDRKSFETIKGYEGIESSIIEDVDLMHKVRFSGGDIMVNNEAVAVTKASTSLRLLLSQRVRWMKAKTKMPVLFWGVAFLRLTFLPTVLVLSFSNPWMLIFISAKSSLTYLVTRPLLKKLDESQSFFYFLYYEMYEFIISFLTFILSLIPYKTKWKGRTYE